MSQTPAEMCAANCQWASWQRLTPQLHGLHWPDASPLGLAQLLDEVAAPLRPVAQRVLGRMARQPWQVQALAGPYRRTARLGFTVHAGHQGWWLQFETVPRLRISAIEPLTP